MARKPVIKQKFFRGHRVHIAADLGPTMSHFHKDTDAIIVGSYSDLYGHGNYTSYELLVLSKKGEPHHTSAWYEEHQLTLVNSDRDGGERMLQLYNQAHDYDEDLEEEIIEKEPKWIG